MHNSVAGHHGVARTIAKLQTQGHDWPSRREHVSRFVRQCPLCQKLSQIKLTVHAHPFTTASYEPMDRLNVDTVGPLPADSEGYCYILVIICCFTRFVELYPIKSTNAEEAAIALLQHFGRYGVPSTLVSDNGSQFVNERIAAINKLVDTEHKFTIAYSKEENGMVERANKEVMRHLRGMLFDKRVYDNWAHVDLPMVMRILNAEEKTVTGVSPAQLLFGNAIQLDRGIFLPRAQPPAELRDRPASPQMSAYMARLLNRQAELIRVAQEHQQAHDDHHMSTVTGMRSEFPVNSYVLVSYPTRPDNKFQTVWRGPCRVVAHTASRYTIQDLVNHKNTDVHITRLRPFLFEPTQTDPERVAQCDQQEFLIEEILAHRWGDPHKRKTSTLEFLVSWDGYDESENSWEPWANLRATQQCHEYLRANGLARLISSKYR